MADSHSYAISTRPCNTSWIQGVIVSNSSTKEVWRKLLSDGDVAVVLLNLGDTPASVTARRAQVLSMKLGVDAALAHFEVRAEAQERHEAQAA